MKRFLAMFDLTVAEQRTIVLVMVAIVAFCAGKTYRDKAAEQTPREEAYAQRSPTPGTRP